jgi:ribosomal protein S18 acetylase RimI-like enzyme
VLVLPVDNFQTKVIIRNYNHAEDFNAVNQVWVNAGKGIHITHSDSQTEIEKLIQKSPGLFFVAEYNNQVIGTAIGGFDGRRGLIYHLAVLPAFQNHQIGSILLQTVEKQLHDIGCTKVYLFILPDNLDLSDFYNKRGYQKMVAIPFTKVLED